ncbi:MAG: hypothetical protein COA78_15290 [Blastopirellula sp.]|nr:MAG: hypothetical protein COA78_15290 [Blastopirellula sp.]
MVQIKFNLLVPKGTTSPSLGIHPQENGTPNSQSPGWGDIDSKRYFQAVKQRYFYHESAIRSQNILDSPDVAPSGAFLNWGRSIPGNEFPGYTISSLTGLKKTGNNGTLFVNNRNAEFKNTLPT